MNLSFRIADFFGTLSDHTRIRILGILHEKSSTVNEMCEKLGNISLQALSYQLKTLVEKNFIKYEKDPKDARVKHFKLKDDHILHILNDAIIHILGGKDCNGKLDCEDNDKNYLSLVIK